MKNYWLDKIETKSVVWGKPPVIGFTISSNAPSLFQEIEEKEDMEKVNYMLQEMDENCKDECRGWSTVEIDMTGYTSAQETFCITSEHQILTDNGWQLAKDIEQTEILKEIGNIMTEFTEKLKSMRTGK